MVSVRPNSQPFNLTHMWDMGDIRGKSKLCIPENSTMGYINDSEHFTLFKKIVNKSRMIGRLSDIQSNSTLFAVPDSELLKRYPPDFFDNMDSGLAHNIISYSTLNRKIDRKLLIQSPMALFNTRNKQNRLFITNSRGKTIIDKKINVIHFNHKTDNGLIHVIDDLLYPKFQI